MLYERTYTRSPHLLVLGLFAGGGIVGATLLAGYVYAHWDALIQSQAEAGPLLFALLLLFVVFEIVRHRHRPS